MTRRLRPQDQAEALAKRLAEAVLGTDLKKEPQRPTKSPDFRPRWPEGGRLAIEVKLLSVKESLALDAQWNAVKEFRRCSSLHFAWFLVVDRPTLDQRLPAHLPRTIRTITLEDYAAGKPPTLIPNPERQPRGFVLPDFRRLRREAEGLLGALEAADIMSTRGFEYCVPEATELVALLQGGMAMAHEPLDGPGYEVVVGFGSSRTGTGEPLVERIAMYLASSESDNLRETLIEGVDPGEARHAFLVLDRNEPEVIDSSWLPDSPPSTVLQLPPMIDRLWVGIEPDLVMWLDRGDDHWQTRRVT